MSQVFIDTGPLGYIVHQKNNAEARSLRSWLKNILASGHEVVIPEICDYELRRELIRQGLKGSINKLDRLIAQVTYLPLTTEVMNKAAELWADVRSKGKPTADKHSLDGDMILSAQFKVQGKHDALVATVNIGHLSIYCKAKEWKSIS